jgi:hypothetical protein
VTQVRSTGYRSGESLLKKIGQIQYVEAWRSVEFDGPKCGSAEHKKLFSKHEWLIVIHLQDRVSLTGTSPDGETRRELIHMSPGGTLRPRPDGWSRRRDAGAAEEHPGCRQPEQEERTVGERGGRGRARVRRVYVAGRRKRVCRSWKALTSKPHPSGSLSSRDHTVRKKNATSILANAEAALCRADTVQASRACM